jgi:uncharacterized membrane protein SpoIIM required for sporulation
MFKLSQILLSPKKAERHPIEIMIVAFFYASISMFISIWIFPDYASLVMVFLTVISCIYVVQGAFIIEETKEDEEKEESWILKEHAKTVFFLLFLFLGFMLAFVLWTIVLPQETSSIVFSLQKTTIKEIQDANSVTGNSIRFDNLLTILQNNLRVLIFSLILALFYGAGSIFILTWNASIMGFAIGNLARNTLGLSSLPLVFLKYLTHGIPEMIAYFVAALAGGIMYILIVRGDIKNRKIKSAVIDLSIIIAISVAILIIAGLIETYISPNI